MAARFKRAKVAKMRVYGALMVKLSANLAAVFRNIN